MLCFEWGKCCSPNLGVYLHIGNQLTNPLVRKPLAHSTYTYAQHDAVMFSLYYHRHL
ncbi:Uncharacterised protein [Vibrio cholerae]|nr:Uncharacterised protein [Vibrio cholerae]CSI50015.1 Uncharacterised protein [Vibrio cholerae]